MFDRLLTICTYQVFCSLVDSPIVLTIQYRCHPMIGNLASLLFYQNQLVNGPNTETIPLVIPSLPRLLFIHHEGYEMARGGK